MAELTPRPLYKNPVSLIGASLVTLSAFLFLFVFALDMFGLHTNPYLGIVFFIVLPALFIVGLLVIPAGMWRERRRRAAGHEPAMWWPRVDMGNLRQRRTVFLVAVLTFVNLLIVGLAAYRGIEFMDSPSFCGQVCHTVMEPEFTAYQDGPHSRVRCVECHIGPGAPWFVKSKLDGTRQVIAVMRNTYSRPISTPVHNLRPARDTCEQCHWPAKFHGDKVDVIREYANDEANTESTTRLLVHVGGSNMLGQGTGIHWHVNVGNRIEYVATDEKRQVIPYVRLTDSQGTVREYRVAGVSDADLAKGERRLMDCVDCHNRPSHLFMASPERAVDDAIARGEIPRGLPYVRREAVAALKVGYPDRVTARNEIDKRLRSFYQSNYPQLVSVHGGDLEQTVRSTQIMYSRNVFPQMNVTWGTHENNLGHTDSPGCFRCHDDNHKSADGRVIRQDCDLCHDIQ
jgi:hypothetical protein